MTPVMMSAIAGALGALLTDLHAYIQSEETFNWKKAVARVLAGAIAGGLTGAGMSTGGVA